MKFNGIESCIRNMLMSTKSPMVCVPSATASADMTMQMPMPTEKMTPWPKFNQPSEVQVLVAADS